MNRHPLWMILLATLITATLVVLMAMFMPQFGNPAELRERALPPANVLGAVDPSVTQANINTTVCVPGYSASVRPPESWTYKLKISLMRTLRLPGTTGDYELDHLIEISAGGSPTSLSNLWMQPLAEARLKDRLEEFEHRALCAGRISLMDVQTIFRGNFWRTYDRLAPSQHWPLWSPDPLPDDLVREMRRQQERNKERPQ